MARELSLAVENLVRKAPADWLTSACEELRGFPPATSAGVVLQRLPATNNSDLLFLMTEVVRLAAEKMSWEALSWTIRTVFSTYQRWRIEQHVELLWAGPAPADRIRARRIDQALYDLIANAKREILLVTFAAAKIERLTGELWKAAQRDIKIRLILEFEESSEGQLSYDAIKAFPQALLSAAEIYHWSLEKRERNQAGRPGKLHAKVAIVDDCVLVSSANLTDDAFNRNLEAGVLVASPEFLISMKTYLESLIADATLSRLVDQQGRI
ncbi:MAG: phospholipase [Betaproteobacteria bacterium]|nr:phospholipase [Betaproteobacteria bacterium]